MSENYTNHDEDSPRMMGNIIMWLIMLGLPVALIIMMELVAFRPVGAESIICERDLGNNVIVDLTVESFDVGNVPHETHRFEVAINGADIETPLDMSINLPQLQPDCDKSMGLVDDDFLWLWNGESVMWRNINDVEWQSWSICDDPRPDFGCIAREYIQSVTFISATEFSFSIFAPESVYEVSTDDSGQTWQLSLID